MLIFSNGAVHAVSSSKESNRQYSVLKIPFWNICFSFVLYMSSKGKETIKISQFFIFFNLLKYWDDTGNELFPDMGRIDVSLQKVMTLKCHFWL